MKLRQWYLGAGAAIAALIPLAANAVSVPNLLGGGGPADISASDSDDMKGKFSGVTTEIAGTVGSGDLGTGGSCFASGACTETTWGVGTIDNIFDLTKSGEQTWQDKDPLTGVAANTSVAFILYGIADKSVVITSDATTFTQTVKNTGATTSAYAGTPDGLIHLDFYYMPSTDKPCFTAGCGTAANRVEATDRTANVGAVAQVTGITNVGTLFASFVLQKGTDDADDVLLSQAVTFQTSSGKTTGSGNQATFYAVCVAGPGCDQFQDVPESHFAAGSFDPTLITDIFGNIGIQSAPGATVFHPASAGPPIDPGCATSTCPNSVGWLFNANDPVLFVAAVPEPGTLALLGSALTFLGLAVRRRRKGISA